MSEADDTPMEKPGDEGGPEKVSLTEAIKKIDEDDYFWACRGSVSRNVLDLLAVIVAALPAEE